MSSMMASSVFDEKRDVAEVLALLVVQRRRLRGLASSSVKPMMLVSGVRSS